MLVLTLAAGEPVLIDQLGLTTPNKERLEKKASSLIVYLVFAGLLALPKLLGCIQLLIFFNTSDTKALTTEGPV